MTDEYRVLWLAAHVDAQKAAAFTAKIGGAAGLVRGKSSLGIRVTSSMFEAAWKVVYPTEQAPADISNKWIYKLEPLPYGCTQAIKGPGSLLAKVFHTRMGPQLSNFQKCVGVSSGL